MVSVQKINVSSLIKWRYFSSKDIPIVTSFEQFDTQTKIKDKAKACLQYDVPRKCVCFIIFIAMVISTAVAILGTLFFVAKYPSMNFMASPNNQTIEDVAKSTRNSSDMPETCLK